MGLVIKLPTVNSADLDDILIFPGISESLLNWPVFQYLIRHTGAFIHCSLAIKIFEIILPKFSLPKPLLHICFYKMLPIKHKVTQLVETLFLKLCRGMSFLRDIPCFAEISSLISGNCRIRPIWVHAPWTFLMSFATRGNSLQLCVIRVTNNLFFLFSLYLKEGGLEIVFRDYTA